MVRKSRKSIIPRPRRIKGCRRMPEPSAGSSRKVMAIHATLDLVLFAIDPVLLNRNWLNRSIVRSRTKQRRPARRPMEQFLEGCACPGGRAKRDLLARRKPQGAARPAPSPTALLAVSALMRERFEAEPWRACLARIVRSGCKSQQPGCLSRWATTDAQRRLKEWRCEVAHQMVFGAATAGETPVLDP